MRTAEPSRLRQYLNFFQMDNEKGVDGIPGWRRVDGKIEFICEVPDGIEVVKTNNGNGELVFLKSLRGFPGGKPGTG